MLSFVDIDECKDNLCPANSQCYNTLGSYSCICDPGYTGDGVTGSPCVGRTPYIFLIVTLLLFLNSSFKSSHIICFTESLVELCDFD